MTGAVSWETLIWLVTLLVAAIGGAGAAILYGVRLFAARDEAIREVAEEASRAREKIQEHLELRIAQVEAASTAGTQAVVRELAAYEIHVAETFATKGGVSQAVEEVKSFVGQLTDRMEKAVDRLSGRIDRLLEQRAQGPRPPGQ